MAQVAERAMVSDLALESNHLEDFTRYRFACGFVSAKRVLDVACGSGYGSALLWREGGANCVMGVDSSRGALLAAQRYQAAGRVGFTLASAERLPFRDRDFGAIVSLETLEHVVDPKAFLRELTRVLRADGQAVISTPLNNSEGRYRPDNPHHCREYSASEFLGLLNDVFHLVEVFSQLSDYGYDPLWSPLERVRGRSWARQALGALIPPTIRRGLRRATGSKGRYLATSRIIPGHHDEAAYQLAVCSGRR